MLKNINFVALRVSMGIMSSFAISSQERSVKLDTIVMLLIGSLV